MEKTNQYVESSQRKFAFKVLDKMDAPTMAQCADVGRRIVSAVFGGMTHEMPEQHPHYRGVARADWIRGIIGEYEYARVAIEATLNIPLASRPCADSAVLELYARECESGKEAKVECAAVYRAISAEEPMKNTVIRLM